MIRIETPGPIRRIMWKLRSRFIKGAPLIVGEAGYNCIYLLEDYWGNKPLIAHEKIHVEQMRREGWLKYRIKYTYYTLRYGYWNNPYEVEAYKVSGAITK